MEIDGATAVLVKHSCTGIEHRVFFLLEILCKNTKDVGIANEEHPIPVIIHEKANIPIINRTVSGLKVVQEPLQRR